MPKKTRPDIAKALLSALSRGTLRLRDYPGKIPPGIDKDAARNYFPDRASLIAALWDHAGKATAKLRRPAKAVWRDLAFDMLMTHLDTLEPWRKSLRDIAEDAALLPPLLRPLWAMARGWAEWIARDKDETVQCALAAVLAALYPLLLWTWLRDETADRGKTMGFLGRALEKIDAVSGPVMSFKDKIRKKTKTTKG